MERRKYTIIHQISGESNLLMENISMFNQICDGANPAASIHFVILSDMMRVLDPGLVLPRYQYLNQEHLDWPVVYRVQQGDSHQTLSESGEMPGRKKWFRELDNLASPANLELVLKEVKKMYPADHYAYVYKGHGGADSGDIASGKFIAVAVGLLPDEIITKVEEGEVSYSVKEEQLLKRLKKEHLVPHGWQDAETGVFTTEEGKPTLALVLFYKDRKEEDLSYRSLSEVLARVFPEGLMYVLLDCCWGMSIENIDIFKKNTRYLVASPDESPATGIGYRQFGNFICRDEEFSQSELAKLLVANYFIINYSDYYSPVRDYRVMGVSFSCADTSRLDPILTKMSALFNLLLEEKQFYRLLNCARNCRDHTYQEPTEYDMYNVDVVWFLENLVYRGPEKQYKGNAINLLALELIKDIKLMLLVGFMGTNYTEVEYGKEALGGRGITFTFPKEEEHYSRSIISGNRYRLYAETGWKKLLLRYYEYKKDRNQQIFEELKGIVRQTLTQEQGTGVLKNISFDYFRQKNLNDKPELRLKIQLLAEAMEQDDIAPDAAFRAVVKGLESPGEQPLIDRYTDLYNHPKWKPNS